jgi:hypothetical protein
MQSTQQGFFKDQAGHFGVVLFLYVRDGRERRMRFGRKPDVDTFEGFTQGSRCDRPAVAVGIQNVKLRNPLAADLVRDLRCNVWAGPLLPVLDPAEVALVDADALRQLGLLDSALKADAL